MILSDEEVDLRLSSPNNLVRVIEMNRGGKTKGSTNIPPTVRDLISITAGSSEEKQKEIADAFGVDGSSVSELSRGMIGGRFEPRLAKVGQDARAKAEDKAHESALDCLMTTLSSLQPKLVDPELKAKELSRIAADMSRVAANLKPKSAEPSVTNNTQVILMRPKSRELNKYEFIESST